MVYWFGTQEKLAGLKNTMSSAEELQHDIASKMPVELQGLVDVFVLDVSVDAYTGCTGTTFLDTP